jgi:hypothetical protein
MVLSYDLVNRLAPVTKVLKATSPLQQEVKYFSAFVLATKTTSRIQNAGDWCLILNIVGRTSSTIGGMKHTEEQIPDFLDPKRVRGLAEPFLELADPSPQQRSIDPSDKSDRHRQRSPSFPWYKVGISPSQQVLVILWAFELFMQEHTSANSLLLEISIFYIFMTTTQKRISKLC